MYTLNDIALSTYGITAGHAPSSNVSMQGVFDMPKRTGTTFKDWDDSDSVEPWVLANEIFFAGRDIVFNGSIQGTTSGMNGYLESFYAAINAASGLSILTTPYNSASGYVKSVTPEYMNGGCSVEITFREPVVSLVGSLPASGSSANMIDSIPFLSFGLYLSKAEALHGLPKLKEQHFTKYGEEGYQIVKRKTKNLDLKGFIIGNSLVDFTTKVQALYKAFSSAGMRSIVLDTNTTVTCFATEGFKVNDITLHSGGVIGKFNSSLIATNVAYDYPPSSSYPVILDDGNTVAWYDYSDTATLTLTGASLSSWADKLGSGHDLLQANILYQPELTADGILFDGVADYMKATAFTYEQPCFIYMLFRQVTWHINDRIFDANVVNDMRVLQSAVTPELRANAGLYSPADDLTVNTFGIIRVLFNGVNSSFQINTNSAASGDWGSGDANGFTLACQGNKTGGFSNIEVKEIILRNVADSEATQTLIYDYLKALHGL